MAHAFGELVSLVNQTYGHVRENREHITALELYAVRLQIAYRNLSDKATSQERYMTDMGRQVAVGQVLDTLEALHTTWRRGIDVWQGQRRALEAGWLTEDILPRGELGRILDAGRASGFHTPALHWYYEHVRIHALWEERGRLASLPLVDSGHYLRYTMRSWEVPSKSPGYYTQLQLPRDVAVSTDSGDLFVPQNCVGHQPAICVAGPLFSSQRYQCPRGVLTGDAQLRHTCQVTLQHRVANNTIIEEITPGQAVIITRGEKLSLLCPREPERRSALTMGVYTLHLGPGCRAKGLGWTLLGPWSHDSKVVLIPPPVYIAPLNLSREVPPEVQRAHRLQQPAWTPLAPPGKSTSHPSIRKARVGDGVDPAWMLERHLGLRGPPCRTPVSIHHVLRHLLATNASSSPEIDPTYTLVTITFHSHTLTHCQQLLGCTGRA